MPQRYGCPEPGCPFTSTRWSQLKVHLTRIHQFDQYAEATAEDMEQFILTPEQVAEPAMSSEPPPASQLKKSEEPPEKDDYEDPRDPVERLAAVLRVNGIEPSKTKRALAIWKMMPAWWKDPYRLEGLLRSHVTKEQNLLQTLVHLYMGGVEVPGDSGSHYQYGYPASSSQGVYYPYAAPPGAGPGFFGMAPSYPPGAYPDQGLRDKVDKLADVVGQLVATNATPTPEAPQMMTIPDEQGRPMTIPYDQSLVDALRRGVEARARLEERREMLQMVADLTGGRKDDSSSLQTLLKPLEERLTASLEEVGKLRTELQEQRFKGLQEQAEAAQEEAKAARVEASQAKDAAIAAARGDKTVVDYMQEAGIEAQATVKEAGKDLRATLSEAGRNFTAVLTRTPPSTPPTLQSLSPAQIADIMEVEDGIMASVMQSGAPAP